jgi:hypothetical protein
MPIPVELEVDAAQEEHGEKKRGLFLQFAECEHLLLF